MRRRSHASTVFANCLDPGTHYEHVRAIGSLVGGGFGKPLKSPTAVRRRSQLNQGQTSQFFRRSIIAGLTCRPISPGLSWRTESLTDLNDREPSFGITPAEHRQASMDAPNRTALQQSMLACIDRHRVVRKPPSRRRTCALSGLLPNYARSSRAIRTMDRADTYSDGHKLTRLKLQRSFSGR